MIRSVIEDAVKTNSYIEIEYSNAKGKKSLRAVADVKFKKDNNYIKAFCCKTHEYRTFKVSRIITARILSDEEIKGLPSYKVYRLQCVCACLLGIIIIGILIYLFPDFFIGVLKFIGIVLIIVFIMVGK